MALSARAHRSEQGVDLRVETAGVEDLRPFQAVDALDPVCPESVYPETVVVHVQLRPRRGSTRPRRRTCAVPRPASAIATS